MDSNRINQSLKKAKAAIDTGDFKDGLNTAEMILMSNPSNVMALQLKAKCEMSMGRHQHAEATLRKAFEAPDANKYQIRQAFLGLYRAWGEYPDRGLKMSLSLMKDVIDEGNTDRIMKLFKEFLHFFMIVDPKETCQIVNVDSLTGIIKDIFSILKIDHNDESLKQNFLGAMEVIIRRNMINPARIDELCTKDLLNIASEDIKDCLLDMYFLNLEQLSSSKHIIELLLKGDKSPYFGLPSYSLYSLKYGFGLDSFNEHFNILMRVFNDRKVMDSKRYRGDLIFILQEFEKISRKAGELLKIPFQRIDEKDLVLLDKRQVELKLDFSKKVHFDPIRHLNKLLDKLFNDESVNYFIKLFKEHTNSANFEFFKMVLMASGLSYFNDTETLEKVATAAELWVKDGKHSPDFRFRTLMFLLDCEDLFSMTLEVNIVKLVEEISSSLQDSTQIKLLNCEYFWNKVDLNSVSSIKETQEVITQTLEDIAAPLDFFSERRFVVFKNRSIVLKLLGSGKSVVEESHAALVELNLKEAENIISQQNLAVVALLQGKINETQYLITKIGPESINDESFAKIALSLSFKSMDLLDKFKDAFDTKYWYILLRGLGYFKIGEYSKAYSFLLNGMKRLEVIRRDSSSRPKSTRKTIVNLYRLRSGRYESKIIFGQEYVSQNCPIIFFEDLSDAQQTDIALNLRFLVAVCNKFLQKPHPAISLNHDLLATLDSMDIQLMPDNVKPLNKIIADIVSSYMTEDVNLRYQIARSKLLESKLAMMCYGELTSLYLYSENHAEAVLNGLLYSNFEDASVVILMELVVRLWNVMTSTTRAACKKSVESLVDYAHERFSQAYDTSIGDSLKFEVLQQTAFLGSFLEYKISREKPLKFLYNLGSHPLLLMHTDKTDNSVLTYNLGIFNETEEGPLASFFSLNYSSWLQYYLKTADLVDPSERIAALLIALNLNFDNQLCWNLLARFMLSQDYLKFSLQALNMSKVFKIGQDVRETEYLICLWVLLLNKAEAASRQGNHNEVVLNYVRGLIRAISGPHQAFLKEKSEEEKSFVKLNVNKTADLSFERLVKVLLGSIERKAYRKSLRLILLYVLKLDKTAEGPEKTQKISQSLELLNDASIIKQVRHGSRELFDKLAGVDKDSVVTDINMLLGVLCEWFLREDQASHQETFSSTILDLVTNYMVNDLDNISVRIDSLRGKFSMPDIVKQLVQKTLTLKIIRKLDSSQLQWFLYAAKRALLIYPQSLNLRTLYNNILILTGNFNGLLMPADEDGKKIPLEFGSDFRLGDIFKPMKEAGPTFQKKVGTLKISILQYPNKKFSQQSLETLVKSSKDQANSQKKTEITDTDKVFQYCKREKNRILKEQFGLADNADKNLVESTCDLWNKYGSSNRQVETAIKKLAAIDNLLLLILTSRPPKLVPAGELTSLRDEISRIVLDDTVLDNTYFVTYLHYLYVCKEFDQLEQIIGVLAYLRLHPEVECFNNYSLLIKKIKDVQLANDESEDTKQSISDLKAYFDTCQVDDLRESAQFAAMIFSKQVIKDKGLLDFNRDATKLISENPRFKDILAKHMSS